MLLGAEAFMAALKGESVLIAAPTLKQTDKVFKEAKKIADRHKIPVRNEKYLTRLGRGSITQTSDSQPDNARGENATLLVLDEAAYCDEYFFTHVLFNAVRIGEPRQIIASTPKGTDNWLSQRVLNPSKNAEIFKATYLDNVYTSAKWKEEVLEEYAISGEMAYRRELMAEILDYAESSPFSQFIKNMNHSEEWEESKAPVVAGVDIGKGGDCSAVAVRKGNRLLSLAKRRNKDDIELQELAEQGLRAAGYERADKLYFDGTGLAALTKGLFAPYAKRVIPVGFGEKATDRRCVNMRTQCYIGLLDRMREGITYGAQCVALKNELVRDLLSARQTPDESHGGRFGLVPKDAIKKEIHRSPDIGDAVALAFVEYNPPDLAAAQRSLADYTE
jgi:hypothetical protein